MLIEAVLIVVILHGLLVGGHHIAGRHLASVGEGGVVLQVDRPVPAVGGNLVLRAENGGGVFLAVHGKQRLIHERHQHPVGIVAAKKRIQGAFRIIGQHQVLAVLRFLRHHRFLAIHQNGIAISDIHKCDPHFFTSFFVLIKRISSGSANDQFCWHFNIPFRKLFPVDQAKQHFYR